jgi:pilus assembly protein Flp/PilA
MSDALARFIRDDGGATAVEYSMIAGLIAAVIAATVYNLGDTVLTALWQRIAGAMPAV